MKEKDKIIGLLGNMGMDIESILSLSFSGYKQLKKNKQLYSRDSSVPEDLIRLYYTLNPSEIWFDKMKKEFVTRYINSESKIEGIDPTAIHGKEEVEGLKKMYEYIHSSDIEYLFDVYTLKELHRQLFSCTSFPEYGGDFRNIPAYLPGTGTELCDWSMIRYNLELLDPIVQHLRQVAPKIKMTEDSNLLLSYLDECVELGCKLVKIHPFSDGNGRTIRGFINKLLEDAGLPPIYIKINERTEYHEAMNKANNEDDYTDIKNFYRYKVCDSIIELDINKRIHEYNKLKDDSSKEEFEELIKLNKQIRIAIRDKILSYFNYVDIDRESIIRLCFFGYKYLKGRKQLYSSDVTIPETLISLYYSLSQDEIVFDQLKKKFITQYVNNETRLEGANEEHSSGEEERLGLKKMYEYLCSDEIEFKFDIYTLKNLHEKLFSYAKYPEYAGDFRKLNLPRFGTKFTDYSLINRELNELNKIVETLRKNAPIIRKNNDIEGLLSYLDACVILLCRLNKIHPFLDGNGRTIRGFINKLLMDIALPPVYIKENEEEEYYEALNKANNEGDYTDIQNFYRYKVCDSIIELDINDRVRKFNEKRGIKPISRIRKK